MRDIVNEYKEGKIVTGRVERIEDYGVFVKFPKIYSGLIHISELSHYFVNDPNEIAEVGDQIRVQILEVDEINCRLKLSVKNIEKKRQKKNRLNIKETSLGFSTLAKKLPKWIEKNLESGNKK